MLPEATRADRRVLYTHTCVVSQRSDHQPEDPGLQVAQAWKQLHDSLKPVSEVAAASMLCELPHAVPGIECYSSAELALHFRATTALPGKRHFSDSPSKRIPGNQASKWRERKRRAISPGGLLINPKQQQKYHRGTQDLRQQEKQKFSPGLLTPQDGDYKPVGRGLHA